MRDITWGSRYIRCGKYDNTVHSISYGQSHNTYLLRPFRKFIWFLFTSDFTVFLLFLSFTEKNCKIHKIEALICRVEAQAFVYSHLLRLKFAPGPFHQDLVKIYQTDRRLLSYKYGQFSDEQAKNICFSLAEHL